ncbi:MAG: EAL domain-containing protein [Lachnospiraceae bacterium]|nr:EAL domain-containing protein [Lachnospiraceae bacterium]
MKKNNMKKFIIMLFVLLSIVVTVLVSSYMIFNELEKQLQQNLEDVANQNSLALHNKIHSQHLLLDSLSENLHGVTPETIEEALQSFTIFLEEYDLKRFAYVFLDGTSYSTDGGVANLSYREFFQRGINGKATITGMLNDALEESHGHVNVMTIPIYDNSGKVEGVFGLTYHSQTFNDTLQIECFDGNGYNCVFNSDGQIMVAMGSETLQLSENIFSDILGADPRNAGTIEKLKNQVEEKAAGGGTFYLAEENYYYCMPVNLMNGDVTWYVLTIIPADFLKSRVVPIQKNLYLMAFIVCALILIGVSLIVMISKERQKMMMRYAYEDPLTKGANYAKFCFDMNKKSGRQGYMVAMDITHFNNINIVAGKSAGDIMIRDIWKILTDLLVGEEFAGHVREDLFIMFLKPDEKDRFLERLSQISMCVNRRAKELSVNGIHCRYGIYDMQGTEDLEDAYSKAQIAREQARIQKKPYYVFYNEMDHAKLQQDQQLEERFEEALAAEEFEVWYQPKYSADSAEIVGSEALVRWRDRDGSMISPGRFIPLLEQNGMIAKLDEYMFRSVCRQQSQWLAKGYTIFPVSINLSRASLYYADIVEKYKNIMNENGVNPNFIQLEVTESTIEGKSDILRLLEKFRSMGIRILMDDFGTGYSSLATLNMRCFDTLKLDKSLIDHIGDENGDTLLYYVISMGQHLGLHITAEGVENRMQLEFLQKNHCDDIQGFLFARPMPTDQFEKILTER